MGQQPYDLKPFGWNPPAAPGFAPRPPMRRPGNPFDLSAASDRIRQMQLDREAALKNPPISPEAMFDARLDYENRRNAGMIDDQVATIPSPEPIDIEPDTSLDPRHSSNAELTGLWATEDAKNDAEWMDSAIAEGEQREAGDRAAEQASLDQIAASVPSPQPVEAMPDAMSEHERVAKEAAERARKAMAASQRQIEDSQIKPLPQDAKPPMGGFAGGDRNAAAGARRAKNAAMDQGQWTDAAEAPLPGEETLPPQIAAWNQNRATSGQPGGMEMLRRAYDIAQDNVPTGETFEEWIRSKGLREDTQPREAQAILDNIVRDSAIEFPMHDPLDKGLGDDPRVNRKDDSILAGRRGVADDTPLDLMPDEQRQKIGTHMDGIPRTARGGQFVWDGTANDGKGGYVPRGVDLNAARKAKTIQEKAKALGIDFLAYGDNIPQLEQDVARVMARQEQLAQKYDSVPVAGGGMRLRANADTQARMDNQRAQQFTNTMAKRFARELKSRGVPTAQIQAYYMEGVAEARKNGSSNPYADAAAYVNSKVLDSLRSQRVQAQSLAVQQRADQYNRARDFRLPESVIRGLDTVAAADTPQQQVRALMAMHSMMPGMGYDKMIAMLMRGQIDSDQLRTWASTFNSKPKGMEAYQANVNELQQGQVGPNTHANAHAIATQAAGPGATPEQIKTQRQNITRPVAARIAKKADEGPITADEEMFVRQETQGMSYKEFCDFLGLDPGDESSMKKYEDIHKKPARDWFARGVDAAGDAIAATPQAIANGLNWLGSRLGGTQPAPAAQAAPPKPKEEAKKPKPNEGASKPKGRRPFG